MRPEVAATTPRPLAHAPAGQTGIPTPLEALARRRTPASMHFQRSHYPAPELDPAAFRLRVDGAVQRPLELDLADLRARPSRTLHVTLECAGHRRTELDPPPSGLPWGVGAIAHSAWTGTSLASVLEQAGVADGACEVVLHGADAGGFGELPGTHAFVRSIPLDTALHPDTLLAWALEGEPLPLAHGAPLRAVVPGWYGVASVKWLVRVEVVREPFAGPYQALDYRFIRAGEEGLGEPLTVLPISALLLDPRDGDELAAGSTLVSGIAWGGEGGPARVELRVDDGPWQDAALLADPREPYAPTHFRAELDLEPGARQLAVRATDGAGATMPDAPEWNVRGYRINAVHRVAVTVGQ
jgi:DMSO/TMAO reductase YedYZ molybdopterin-dependent catalytic subunit